MKRKTIVLTVIVISLCLPATGLVARKKRAPTVPEDMVFVPAGWFLMGCNEKLDSQCEDNEKPYHPVYLDAFCIDKYEYPNKAGVKPRENVNWSEAQQLCSAQRKRLPTEAEWEKAARGTDERTYPWGGGIDSSKARYNKTHGGPKPTGSYSVGKSPYGAYDMAGNLWEWTADWYGRHYYQNSPNRNPKGPSGGTYRVLRGGSWRNFPFKLRSSYRVGVYPDSRSSRDYGSRGFRCARTQ